MTHRSDGPARPLELGDAAERARAREAQHAVLADLLGAYADGELPAESAARVEAHLVGCTRCRRDLALQIALRDRLAAEVVCPAPASLRDRITTGMTAAPPAPTAQSVLASAPETTPATAVVPAPRITWRGRLAGLVAALALTAAALGSAILWRARSTGHAQTTAPVATPITAARVPLLAAVLAEYDRSTAGDLPGRARDLDAVRAAVGFSVEPLRAPGLRLLAVWTTMLDGEPAAVLAYRRDDRLLLQFLVPESLFFRHAALRAAAAAHRGVAATEGTRSLVAWAEPAAGSVLVGEDSPEQLAATLPLQAYGQAVGGH